MKSTLYFLKNLLGCAFCMFILTGQQAVAQRSRLIIDANQVVNKISPLIYGSCIEDVNHEIYGGLYDQLIFGESFEEDYLNMTFEGFESFGGNWSIASSVLSVNADDGAKLLYDTPITDGSVEVEMKFDNPRESAALTVCVTNPQTGADNWDGYEIGLNAITREIILGKHMHNWQALGNTPVSFNPNEWTRLRVEISGARIRVYVNDAVTPNVEFTDYNSPLLYGKIGVRTWRSNVSFRNLKVKTGDTWAEIPFSGSVKGTGQWDIFRENNTAEFIRETQNVFNGKAAQQIVYTEGSGKAGLINGGLNRWGIAVREGQLFNGRIYLRSADFEGKVTVAIQSADGKTVYASQELGSIGTAWRKYPFTLTSNTKDEHARFAVWIQNSGSIWIDQVTLERTGEDRFHNLPYRADIGNAMVNQGLNFLRYGGTMVNAPEYRFKKMIGDPDLRPPYRGHWYPFSTNGFGIEDFLKFCEAAGFEASFAINIEETAQDAADMVEYLNGDITTEWGAKRAANGHPIPYKVKYIEIGNEEVLFNGDVTAEYTHYIERFLDLYTAMKAKDPNLKFINAAWWRPESANMKRVFDALNGKADYWDYHPWTDDLNAAQTIETELRQMQSKFKGWDPNTNMKCAILEENGNTHNLQRALAHAKILNTVRRMGDFVLTSCAANALQPYMQNDNGWDQGQIFFTPSQVWGMPTFYAQQMASNNHLPLLVTSGYVSGLDVTATRSENGDTLVLHIVNTSPADKNTIVQINGFSGDGSGAVNLYTLSGALNQNNTPANPEQLKTIESTVPVRVDSFSYNFPAYSYTIMRFDSFTNQTKKITADIDITINPNPASDSVHIECKGTNTIHFIDNNGKVVQTETIDNSSNVDISSLSNGIYYVRRSDQPSQTTVKFMKI